MLDLVSTWMGDCLSVTQADSAFYPPWDGKVGNNFRAE